MKKSHQSRQQQGNALPMTVTSKIESTGERLIQLAAN